MNKITSVTHNVQQPVAPKPSTVLPIKKKDRQPIKEGTTGWLPLPPGKKKFYLRERKEEKGRKFQLI
jgi:hypothetical protein